MQFDLTDDQRAQIFSIALSIARAGFRPISTRRSPRPAGSASRWTRPTAVPGSG